MLRRLIGSWMLDTPMFEPTKFGGPKPLCVDLESDRVVQRILFEPDVALPTSYLNDVRFDLGRAGAGIAYITDSACKEPTGWWWSILRA